MFVAEVLLSSFLFNFKSMSSRLLCQYCFFLFSAIGESSSVLIIDFWLWMMDKPQISISSNEFGKT
ncbi:hypothetical protein EBS43_00560 [bacterium]|nr:hypothetical protein [bacterium]